MTLEEAEQTLSVKRGADFETVVRAKNKQLGKAVSDEQKFAVCPCIDPSIAVRRTRPVPVHKPPFSVRVSGRVHDNGICCCYPCEAITDVYGFLDRDSGCSRVGP